MALFDISFQDFFCKPAVYVPNDASKTRIANYDAASVEYKYNRFGYRTHEFDSVTDKHVLVVGCSLSEGEGLHLDETWTNKVQEATNTQLVNLSKRGSGAEFACQNIVNWTSGRQPQLVIAQWPDPYRIMIWKDGKGQCITNHNPEYVFETVLKHADENFLITWIKCILEANQICRAKNIKIINLYFGSPDIIPNMIQSVLTNHGIDLAMDLKQQDQTWHFDSSAHDLFHHSDWCNTQWAKRILTLIDRIK